uniref:pathogen-associated molecular patterns-induced protein A70-like n=1 Tax=Erigeron canadensis TaxID=72917 RepID=UPI001CB92CD6|nr:pathogen-associated molecular patterns-induced protein A70-like [Erigeron canadensis]
MEKVNESMISCSSSSSSLWSYIISWCTPIVLFGVANLIIATLFLASKTNTNKTATKQQYDENDHDYGYIHGASFTPIVARVSSIFERAKSIDLSSIIPKITTTTTTNNNDESSEPATYTSLSRLSQSIFSICEYDSQPDSPRYPSNKPKPNPPTSSILGRLKSIDFSSIYGVVDNTKKSSEDHKSDDSLSQLVRVPTFFDRIKSFRIVAPLMKTRSEVKKLCDPNDTGEEEVRLLQRPETARAKRNAADDAKAENFITKFREQLKLQRRDSFARYNDMLRN